MSDTFNNSAVNHVPHSQRPYFSSSMRACIVRFDMHPGDSRVENQAQALREAGFAVDIICMRYKDQSLLSTVNGLRLFRLPSLARYRGNILLYAVEYITFCLSAFLALSFLQLRYRYRLVQVCNLPDFLVFTSLIPKLCGAKVLLDFRESMVEMYAAKYDLPMKNWRVRQLGTLERLCVQFADHGLTCTEQMKQGIVRRGTPPSKITVMLNSVDPAKFNQTHLPDPSVAVGSRFNIITHGSIIPRYGHEVLIRSMSMLRRTIPEARLTILGGGQEQERLEELSCQLGVDDIIEFTGWVSDSTLIEHLQCADVGAVTMIRNVETDLIHTLKMFEYMTLGVPVVISRTSAVEHYFDETMVRFFKAEDPVALTDALLSLRNNPELRYQLAENAYEHCSNYSSGDQKRIFMNAVNNLTRIADAGEAEKPTAKLSEIS